VRRSLDGPPLRRGPLCGRAAPALVDRGGQAPGGGKDAPGVGCGGAAGAVGEGDSPRAPAGRVPPLLPGAARGLGGGVPAGERLLFRRPACRADGLDRRGPGPGRAGAPDGARAGGLPAPGPGGRRGAAPGVRRHRPGEAGPAGPAGTGGRQGPDPGGNPAGGRAHVRALLVAGAAGTGEAGPGLKARRPGAPPGGRLRGTRAEAGGRGQRAGFEEAAAGGVRRVRRGLAGEAPSGAQRAAAQASRRAAAGPAARGGAPQAHGVPRAGMVRERRPVGRPGAAPPAGIDGRRRGGAAPGRPAPR